MNRVKKVFSFIGKMFNAHPLIFLAVLSFIENFAIEAISRHSVFAAIKYLTKNPAAFLYNALIILVTLSLCLLFRRRVFGVVLLSAPWIICGIINGAVLSYRVTPLGAIDFQIVKMSLIMAYLTKPQRILLYIAAGAFVVAIIALWIIGPKISGKVNYGKNAASIVGIMLALGIATNIVFSIKAVSTDFGNIAGAYQDYGFVYCFSQSALDTGIKKPGGYSEEKTQSLIAGFDEDIDTTEKIKPDVILIQLESFLDPKSIKGLTFSDDPAPIHTYLRENFTSGALHVPSYGGGTANTEFEVLTGINLDNFGPGEYPYKTIMLEQTAESLAFNLKELGYSAHAIHNHTGNFYDRDKVYPNLGFDTFQSKEYMNEFETTPYGWCKDKELTSEIMTALNYVDEDKGIGEDTPRFVWTVSVQGHGSYPSEPIAGADNVIKIEGENYSESELCALQYYINQVWEMDMFLGSLISAVQNRNKPTLIIAYGDHLPSIGLEASDLVSGDEYCTEYVTWNNFDLEFGDGKDLFSYELSGEIMHALGFNNGNLTKLHHKKAFSDTEMSDDEYQKAIQLLAYDMLYGKNYQFGGTKPYEKSNMRMGTVPIEIEAVKYMGDSLYIHGTGFTGKSKIFINGRQCKTTVMLSQYSLMTSGVNLNEGDEITVGQSSSKREFLGYTKPVQYSKQEHFIEQVLGNTPLNDGVADNDTGR